MKEIGAKMEDEKIKKKKTILVLPVLIIVFCAFALFIYFFSSARESDKYSKKIALAQRYFDDMEYEKAIAAFEEAITINPKNEDAYFGLADIYIAIAEDGVDEYYELLGEGNDSKAEKAFENAINAIDSAEATLKKYEKNVGSKVPDKYQKKLDALGEEIDELSDSASIGQTTDDSNEDSVGVDEEIDNSPEAEEIYADYVKLNEMATVCTKYWGTSYNAENIDYDALAVFLWWYEAWGNEFVEDYSYDVTYDIKYISYDNANKVLNSYFYGNITMPKSLYNNEVIGDWIEHDSIYYSDDGYYATCSHFGLETDYANLYSIEKVAPNHYLVKFKTYYVEMDSVDYPDDLYVNSYSYTIEELEQYSDIIWSGENSIEYILTDDGYRIYKTSN